MVQDGNGESNTHISDPHPLTVPYLDLYPHPTTPNTSLVHTSAGPWIHELTVHGSMISLYTPPHASNRLPIALAHKNSTPAAHQSPQTAWSRSCHLDKVGCKSCHQHASDGTADGLELLLRPLLTDPMACREQACPARPDRSHCGQERPDGARCSGCWPSSQSPRPTVCHRSPHCATRPSYPATPPAQD